MRAVAEEPPFPGEPAIGGRPRPVSDDRDRHFRAGADLEPPTDLETWQIVGLLRPKTLMVLASAEGVGKSYVRCEAGIRLATGTGGLFGHYAIAEAGSVMVLDEENGDGEEYRREEAILAGLGLTRASLRSYFRLSHTGMMLSRPDRQRWLRGEVASLHPALIIMDTGGAMVADEWGSSFKDAIRFLRSIITEYGCSILVCVHLVKPPRENGRGSVRHGSSLSDVMGQWTRSADVVAVLSDLGAGRAQWVVRKRVPPSSLVLAQQGGLWSTVAVGEDHQEANTDDRVLRAIAADAGSADALVSALGLSRRAVYNSLARLRADNLVENGIPLRLTPAGEESAG